MGSRYDAKAWLRASGQAWVADLIEAVEAGWRKQGRRTRRNWWDVLAGDRDGQPRTIAGVTFPVIAFAQSRQRALAVAKGADSTEDRKLRRKPMPSDIRAILDDVPANRLGWMCRDRGLASGGDQDDKRARLARSFRGDLDALLPYLRKQDLVAVLRAWTFVGDGLSGSLENLGRASRSELVEMMHKAFVDGWSPSKDGEHPVGRGSPIRFRAEGSDEDLEVDDDEDVDEDEDDDEEDDDENDDDENDDDDADPVDSDGEDDDGAEEERSLDGDFRAWLGDFMAGKERANLLVKTLVNRLGRYRADLRLSTRAVVDVGRVLAEAGFVSDPDLSGMTRSPGIDARVTIRPRRAGGHEIRDPFPPGWDPIPTNPEGNHGRRPPTFPPPPTPATPFELAAKKVQFLTLVAASVTKLDDGARRLAADVASRGLDLGPADQIRLRAMAHQYASGHGDLNPVVAELRKALPAVARRSLLDGVLALAPSTPELTELLAVYATDLGISADPPRPEPPMPPSEGGGRDLWPDDETTENSGRPAHVPVEAGGVRDNPALDSIFDLE